MNMPMNMPINNNIKLTKIKICSPNCRSLSKPSKIDASEAFFRFLRSKDLDILCLQETHAASTEIQERLNIQLQAQDAIWSQHSYLLHYIANTPFPFYQKSNVI